MRLILAVLLLVSTVARSADNEIVPMQLFNFHANGLGVFQKGGETFTGQVAWAPYTLITDEWGARFDLGLTFLKEFTGGRFFALNYEVLGNYWVGREVVFEAGGGLATWIGNGGTHPIVSVNAAGVFAGFPKRIFAGYSYFFLPGTGAHQIKVGLGFHF